MLQNCGLYPRSELIKLLGGPMVLLFHRTSECGIINIAFCRKKLEESEAKKLTHEGDELVRLRAELGQERTLSNNRP